ncbi:MAG: spore germination protein [Firmicutes bacterium]|nr:spore germination protein [Bacillota bacterium]
MFSFFKKRLRHSQIRKQAAEASRGPSPKPQTPVDASLAKNLHGIKALFGGSEDFVARPFLIRGERKAAICYVDGLVKSGLIHEAILKPFMIDSRLINDMDPFALASMEDVTAAFLVVGEVRAETDLNQAAEMCLNGDVVLFIDKMAEALVVNAKGWEKRAVTDPQTDAVIRGPREGFTESLRTNTALIRRRIKIPELRMDPITLGVRSRTHLCVTYIENVANPALVEEVKRRLHTIDTDAIINSGYVEEFIEDTPLSLFPTIYYTEKPDVVAGKLLEGRVAVITDGTPFVLTMPFLFMENFQSAEDYTVRPPIAFVLRLIRLLSFFISLVTPAFYIALTKYHQELIPTPLLFTMAAISDGLPFPSAVETAIMLAAFELIKEAGIRLPKPVGQAISIVGALVMGQAATQAGLVSAPVVIIVALTAVTSFTSPTVSDVTTILRWFLLVLATVLGGLGITLGLLTILVYLASIKSFSTDYLAPFAPLQTPDILRDTLYRAPLWSMRTRPASLKPFDAIRQKMSKPNFNDNQRPGRGERRR